MKKFCCSVIAASMLIGPMAFAQKGVDLQNFEQVKQMMLPVMAKSIEPLEKTRDCVIKSKDSDQLNACVEIMASFHREVTKGSGRAHSSPVIPKLEWSKARAEQIRSDLDRSILETSAGIKCMQSSKDHKTMNGCMTKAGFGQKK